MNSLPVAEPVIVSVMAADPGPAKVTPTEPSARSGTTQVGSVPHSSFQPANSEPSSGCSYSMASPITYALCDPQSVPQSIPLGTLVILPVPVPLFATKI